MTQTTAPSAPATAAARRRDTAARTVLSLSVLLLGVTSGLVAAFAGYVVWTDCLLGCGAGGDPLDGALLGLLAAVLLGGGAWGARAVWHARAATVRAGLWVVGGLAAAWALTGVVDALLWQAAQTGCPEEPAQRYACASRAHRSLPLPAVPAVVLTGAGTLAARAWRRG